MGYEPIFMNITFTQYQQGFHMNLDNPNVYFYNCVFNYNVNDSEFILFSGAQTCTINLINCEVNVPYGYISKGSHSFNILNSTLNSDRDQSLSMKNGQDYPINLTLKGSEINADVYLINNGASEMVVTSNRIKSISGIGSTSTTSTNQAKIKVLNNIINVNNSTDNISIKDIIDNTTNVVVVNNSCDGKIVGYENKAIETFTNAIVTNNYGPEITTILIEKD